VAFEQAQGGREASEGMSGKAQEVAAQAKEQVQEKAGEVKTKASDRLREQLDTRTTQLGHEIGSFADALRKAAQHLENEGKQSGAKAAHQAVTQLERLGRYLTDSDSNRFLGDAERFGRQRPWAAGAIGAVAGFIGARFLRASSESRYQASYRAQHDADLPLRREHEETTSLSPSEAKDYPLTGHASR